MLAAKRQELILEQAKRFGQVSIQQLSDELQVSSETIRRDIQMLSENSYLVKVHGGAIYRPVTKHEGNYAQRSGEYRHEKEMIARCAVKNICDNDIIAIDTGATLDWLSHCIPNVKNLTIIISSISALNILNRRIENGEICPKVIFLPGEFNSENQYVGGPLTIETLKRFGVDKCFIGTTAVCEDGAYMYDVYDSSFTSTLIGISSQVFLLVVSEKIGKKSLCKFSELSQLDYLITDDTHVISPSMIAELNRNNITYICAKKEILCAEE